MNQQPNKQTTFYLKKLKEVIGYTITGLHYTPSEDGNDNQFISLHLKNRDNKEKLLWLFSDDGGECPGSFDITNP